MGVVRRLVAVAMCLPLLFSCSEDEPSPEPEASTSTSATSSPSPSPTGPTIPPAAQGTDEASAKAFVRFWFESLSQAMNTGNVAAAKGFSHSRCSSCTALLDAITDVYDSGGRFQTAGWQVELITRAPAYTQEQPDFLLRTRHAKRDLFNEKGALVDSKPPQIVAMRAVLSRDTDAWTLFTLEEIK